MHPDLPRFSTVLAAHYGSFWECALRCIAFLSSTQAHQARNRIKRPSIALYATRDACAQAHREFWSGLWANSISQQAVKCIELNADAGPTQPADLTSLMTTPCPKWPTPVGDHPVSRHVLVSAHICWMSGCIMIWTSSALDKVSNLHTQLTPSMLDHKPFHHQPICTFTLESCMPCNMSFCWWCWHTESPHHYFKCTDWPHALAQPSAMMCETISHLFSFDHYCTLEAYNWI